MADNDEIVETLAAIDSTIKEILRWVRFSSLQDLKKVLAETLVEDEERIVFELTDGNRSTIDVSKISGVPQRTVARRWQTWTKIGIVERTEKYGGSRVRQICSLEDVGIVVPRIKTSDTKKMNEGTQIREVQEGEEVKSQ